MGIFKIYITLYFWGHWIKTCETGRDKEHMGEQELHTAYGGQPEGIIPLLREEYVGSNFHIV